MVPAVIVLVGCVSRAGVFCGCQCLPPMLSRLLSTNGYQLSQDREQGALLFARLLTAAVNCSSDAHCPVVCAQGSLHQQHCCMYVHLSALVQSNLGL